MEYLHLFKTKTDHDSFYRGNKYKEPWLAYIRDNTLVTGNKSYEYYRNEYFTLSALEDGEITITIPAQVNSTYATSLSYSKDKSNWTETVVDNTEQTITIPVSNGDNVYLKGVAKAWYNNDEGPGAYIDSSANINASGNIMSLLYGDNYKNKTAFPDGSQYTLCGLFANNTQLINAENLILPATTLANGCYYYMFQGCDSLTTAPKLPATTLANGCYSEMFQGCTSLTAAPKLPATTLAMGCYSDMFQGCTSLTAAPKLPATTLAMGCYSEMFYGCTSLTTAPELQATILVMHCYDSMFYDCTSLTTAPELQATTLADSCYYYMFFGCTSLTTAPELPATTLADSCYGYMFQGCSSLTTAPELPATTLTDSCYNSMFIDCSSLTAAPELPATTLTDSCYNSMFWECSKLNNITMLATDISASECLTDWVSGVASTGTFTKAASMSSLTTGTSGIPSGWTVVNK